MVADGHEPSTVTVAASDGNGSVTHDSGVALNLAGAAVSSATGPTNNHDGTYTFVLTSSYRPGVTTITATVTDANGNPVPAAASLVFSATGGVAAGAPTDNQDGTYTSTLTSSAQPGASTVTAEDTATGVMGTATLTQTPAASATSLTASPSIAATNQPVTFTAVVSGGAASGTITFVTGGAPVGGCPSVAISAANQSAQCAATFAAASSRATVTAVFTPDANSDVAGSASAPTGVWIVRDATSMTLGFSNNNVRIGQRQTYMAFMLPVHAGAVAPTGWIEFLDHGAPIATCTKQPLSAEGGVYAASCTVPYAAMGSPSVTAVYSGDGNFGGSSSGAVTIPVKALGLVGSPMSWSFSTANGYTVVRSLSVKAVPAGATVLALCAGSGCPFARATAHASRSHASVNLLRRFAKRRLRAGAVLTIDVTRPGWLGKYYAFRFRAKQGPKVSRTWLAPGTSKPTQC